MPHTLSLHEKLGLAYKTTRTKSKNKISQTIQAGLPGIWLSRTILDFFEIWEESVLSDQLENTSINQAGKDTTTQNVHFIPSDREIQNLDEFANTAKRSPVKVVFQFVRIKSRILIGFFSTFLNNNWQSWIYILIW